MLMGTKLIDSLSRARRISSPVDPPRNPIKVDSSPRAFNARATFTPFPPPRNLELFERCTVPGSKCDSSIVLSIARFKFTIKCMVVFQFSQSLADHGSGTYFGQTFDLD